MKARTWRLAVAVVAVAAVLSRVETAQAQTLPVERTTVLLDTDLGTDIDDALALALILGSQELELRGVTTVGGKTEQRALMACRFLTMTGRRHTAVAAGKDQQPERPITGQHQYYYHPDPLFNRTTRPDKLPAADFLHARLKAQPGKVTILATGPLTNVARLLDEKADAKSLIRRVVLVESNIKLDAPAARTVFASGVPLIVVSADVCTDLKLRPDEVKKVLSPGTALTRQAETLFQLWDQEEPPLADVLAASLCFNETFCRLADRSLQVDDQGRLQAGKGKANARLATALEKEKFVKWYVERMASLVSPARKPSRFVEQGRMPNRVHVAEDYDLDIERRWWMSGKAETKNLPPGGVRACRGVLTHDFDDLLMPSRQMYKAVIFNPVPGPPMGKNPRLSFRYWLKGTDTLRVQIYSLTNGYHRHLVLTGLPQGKWQSGTVDMTQARRPDGTGGPLSEGERIDDIQFYADADAELLIDDIVLYDRALPGEDRSFPKRILFTAGFDSGKQGKEWPGDFLIVQQKGFFWHAAQSVANKELGVPWIRLGLKGERPLLATPQVYFRYHLSGADSLRVVLVNSSAKNRHEVVMKGLGNDGWAGATADFTKESHGKPPGKGNRVDEIQFLLPRDAQFLVDDVLLYEPVGD